MNSQFLIVDLVRSWHKHPDNALFSTKELEHFNITLVSIPVEFEGTEEFKAMILWDKLPDGPAEDATPTELQKEIHDTIKRFAIGINAKITQVVHDNRTTKITLKTTAPKNVEAYEWLELKVEEYKNVE